MYVLHAEAARAGLEIDHHESDLYLRPVAEALEVVKADPFKWSGVGTFFQGDVQWLEIPFAYLPHFERS